MNNYFFSSNREDASPFECGFDPKDKARLPFSIRFYFILILFLIFDIELGFVLHYPLVKRNYYRTVLIVFGIVIFIITLGLFEEWRRGLIAWVYKNGRVNALGLGPKDNTISIFLYNRLFKK